MKKLIYILLATAIIWQLQGCDDDVNPCEGEEPVTARFEIMEKLGHFTQHSEFYDKDSLFVTDDTLKTFQTVYFVAEEKDGYTYEWKVGFDDRIFEGASFTLKFSEVQNNIPIRLIVRGEPNSSCFTEDNGIDTVYRYLTIVERFSRVSYGRDLSWCSFRRT